MEPVGLAVGVVGLAGLFSSCLEAVDKIQSYLNYEGDNHVLDIKFATARIQLERWGRQVGFDNGELLADHHPALDDGNLSAAVVSLINIIKTICNANDALARQPKRTNSGFADGPRNLFHPRAAPGGAESKRQKLAWALWGKNEREDQVNMFRDLVQELHNLIPLSSAASSDQSSKQYISWDNQRAAPDESSFIVSSQILQRIESRIQTKIKAETRRDIALWLMGNHLPNERYDQSTRKRLEGTCSWILDRSEFLDWVCPTDENSEDSRVLWITGPAGFGKTILCASLVSHLSAALDLPVAHYFFSSNANNDNDPYVAIRSWISQISSSNEDAFKVVYNAWESNTDQVSSRATITNVLGEVLECVPGCTLIADGLDEVPSISSFLEAVMDTAIGTNTRILMVSRDEVEIRQALTGRPQITCTEYKILLEDVRNDTKACSRSIVDRKLPNKSEDIRSGISETMAARCEGQFLWLELQEEILRKGMSKKQLERAISDAPAGLERLYDQNWEKIMAFREAERIRAFALLRWAAFAQRPLTVSEITEAVIIDDEMDELMIDDLPDEVDEDYVETEIVGLCASLLEVKAQTLEQSVGLHTVQLKHFSVKQYLLSHLPLPSWISANERLQMSYEQIQSSMLAKLCLHYINLPTVWLEGTDEKQLRPEILFREYASTFWHNHLKSGSESVAELAALTRRFFKQENACWIAWRKWFESQDDVTLDSETVLPDPLYYAIRLGLKNIALSLIDSEELDFKGPVPSGRPVLIEACDRNGAVEIVKRLFEKGADVAVRGRDGWTPLITASHFGHVEIVQLLLEMNADASEREDTQTTPLYFAAYNGYVEVAKMLLKHGADVNAVQQQGWAPVSAASSEHKYDMVELLLDHGADVNTTNENGWTPLSIATCSAYTDIVRLLLNHGANTNISNANNWTPLALAASNAHREVVKLLLSHGAEVDVANDAGYTPLTLASDDGDIEVVRTLLHHGASISGSKHPKGYTPLMRAAMLGHTEVARLLIQAGADLAPVSADGWSALRIASYNGHIEMVRLLLDHGADISAAHKGWTPLMGASWQDCPDVVQLLIERGASPLEGATHGRSALSIAIEKGHDKVLEVLVAHVPEDLPATNELTPIFLASKLGRIDAVNILLQSARLRPEATDRLGRTALFMAARFGKLEVVQVLLDDGRIDPDATDCYGSTALFAAVRNGHADVVALLLAAKGPLWHMQDGFGRSLEWWAERFGHSEILRLLRKTRDPNGSSEADNVGAPPGALPQEFDPDDSWCDCCTLSITGVEFYSCDICEPATLILCGNCFGQGFRCLDKSHDLRHETSAISN